MAGNSPGMSTRPDRSSVGVSLTRRASARLNPSALCRFNNGPTTTLAPRVLQSPRHVDREAIQVIWTLLTRVAPEPTASLGSVVRPYLASIFHSRHGKGSPELVKDPLGGRLSRGTGGKPRGRYPARSPKSIRAI